MPESKKTQNLRAIQTAANVTIAVILLLVAVYFARPFLFPAILALLASFALRPLVRFFQRIKIPPFVGSLMVVTTVIALVGIGLYSISGPASKWFERTPDLFENIERKIRPMQESVEQIEETVEKVDQLAERIEDKSAQRVEVAQPTVSNKVLGATSESLLQIGLTISLLFVLLAFNDQLIDSFSRLGRTEPERINIRAVFVDIEQMISRYLLYYTMINICLGVVIGLGLFSMGMPNPLLWGAMAALLNFIPVVGLAIGSFVVLIVALISFDSMWYALLAPAIYLAANLFEANIATPSLLGRTMQLNTIFLYGALLLWGFLWGVGGILIAVPLMASVKIISEHFKVLTPISVLLSTTDVKTHHPQISR